MTKQVTNEERRKVMNLAWQFARQTGETFSVCLKKAWANFRLKVEMAAGVVRFHFQKTDGTVREAWGTLKGVADMIKGSNRSKNPSLQVYYDTEKQAFRSFKKFNLVTL